MELKFRTLRADEIDVRVGQVSDRGISLLLYKDARCDMNILDEVVGPMGWMRSHSRENANCTVSIYNTDTGAWVSKEDTGTESKTEAEKGLASDSFKRACVNWGIGRELYTSPRVFIEKKYLDYNKQDKLANTFEVLDIEYDSDRRIVKLVIGKMLYGDPKGTVYSWAEKSGKGKITAVPCERVEEPSGPAVCQECGGEIGGLQNNGVVIRTADQVRTYIMGKVGREICWNCFKANHGDK